MSSLLFLETEAQADSWAWLKLNSPRHARALQADVDAGATLEQIISLVERNYSADSGMVFHLPQAAAHLIREREQEASRP